MARKNPPGLCPDAGLHDGCRPGHLPSDSVGEFLGICIAVGRLIEATLQPASCLSKDLDAREVLVPA
jgi:hypothetical protein